MGNLDKTLRVTPKLFSNQSSISSGAQDLFSRCMMHAKAQSNKNLKSQSKNDSVNIVVKKTNSEGVEVVEVETIDLKRPEDDERNKKGRLTSLVLNKRLKMEILQKRIQDLKKKEDIMRLNNEEDEEF